MAATPRSVHPPVEARSIRLLQLEAGQHDDPIRFSLLSVSLDSEPVYEAISYCWGDSSSRQDVFCSGTSKSITTSLWGALREFRHDIAPRTLWADGICINQDDDKEKTCQVRLMHEIYAKAKMVLVWLGPMDESGHLSRIFTSIERLDQFLSEIDPETSLEAIQRLITEMRSLDRRGGPPNVEQDDLNAIFELIRRPWFTRKWVVQEIAMAQDVQLRIGGGVQLPWSHLPSLVGGIHWLSATAVLLSDWPIEEIKAFGEGLSQIQIMQHIAYGRLIGRGTLVDVVMMTSVFSCSDPRDNIYGLLSCVSEGPSVDPDYALSIEDTFKSFTQTMLTKGRNLKVLSLEPHKGNRMHPYSPRDTTRMPSWVPDLRRASDTMIFHSISASRFRAGGSQSPVLSFSGDGRFLHCQGIIVDEIEGITPSMYEMLLDELPELFEKRSLYLPIESCLQGVQRRTDRWLRACYGLGYRRASLFNKSSKNLKDAFSCTLLCDQGSSAGGMASEEMINATFEYVEHLLFQDDTLPPAQRLDEMPPDSPRPPKLGLAINTEIHRNCLTRSFSVTTGGRQGQMPIGTERGDLVCILIGGEVPFVIRPTGPGSTSYHLIGECFLNGVMNGEALASNEYAEREIVLE